MLSVCLVLSSYAASSQEVAVKTNALYWATATPNIGLEASVGKQHTVQLFCGLNPWKQSDGKAELRHLLVMPEYRYWFCQGFNGWFVGAHLMGGLFNVSDVDMPFGMLKSLDGRRHEGWYVGGGITAGYQWPLSRHWNVEASLGVGYDYLEYDKFRCGKCGERLKSGHANYIGPTKLAISIMYMF